MNRKLAPSRLASWRASSNVAFALLAAWCVLIACLYYRQPDLLPSGSMVRRFFLPSVHLSSKWALFNLRQGACLVWLTFLGLGSGIWLLSLLKIQFHNRAELIGLATGLGWGMLGTILAILGLFKLWSPVPVFAALAVLTIPIGVAALRSPVWRGLQVEGPWSLLERFLGFALAIIAAVDFVGALMPEIFYDALVYHLAVPELYWLKHGFSPVAHNMFSGFPMLTEMLYALALPLGGTQSAHLLHWAFGVLCALLTYGFCRRFGARQAGLIAALLFYSSPIVGTLSCKAAVDLSLTFFLFASIYMMVVALEGERGGAWRLLSGLFAGMALGTKYTAWPAVGILAAILLWRLLAVDGLPIIRAARRMAAFLLPAAIVCVVWPARNWRLYGNPVFPFFRHWFHSNGEDAYWAKLTTEVGWQGWSSLASLKGMLGSLLRLWHASTNPYDALNIGPLLIFGLPLLVLFRYRGGAHRLCLAVALLLWALWDISTGLGRFLLPVLPLFSVLYALAIWQGFESSKKIRICLFLCGVATVNLLMTAGWLGTYDSMDVVWGSEPAETYLSEPHPSYALPSYPAIKYIRDNLPKEARVLFMAEARGYGTGREYVAATSFDENPVSEYLRQGCRADQLRERLKKDGYTHVLINGAEIMVRGQLWFNWGERGAAVWTEFSKRYLRRLFERGDMTTVERTHVWCGVYEII